MSDDPTRDVREAFAVQGIEPTDEELVAYSVIAPMLRALVDQLYLVEMDAEL